MRKALLSSILCLFIFNLLSAQANFPDKGILYDDTVVPRIDIAINPDTLVWLYQNVNSDIEFHAQFVFTNGTVHDTIQPVGFRLRGNTSRYSQKKSFKVSFNTFTSGGKYYGVEKLNLNGEHNDPSIMRSKMMWDILRQWDIPAPRSNHVQIYINGDYYGLYLNVEHIDEEFALNRFGNNDGNLYKCTYPVDLVYLGTDQEAYKYLSGSERAYELKINEEIDDYSDLVTFIQRLDKSSDQNLICELDEVFNTYDYLKVIAADVFCGNWDGYIFNKNNFYLYHNTNTGKFEYIPYDIDNTFGIDWFDIDWAQRDIYNWQMDESSRPLYTRLMNHPVLRNQFTHYAKSLIENTLDIDGLIQRTETIKNRIAPYVMNDPYYPLDYGYTYNDFLRSYTEAIGAHVKYGLYPYLNARKASMLQQVESTTMKPIIKYISHKRIVDEQVTIKAYVDVEVNAPTVQLLYAINDEEFNEAEMEAAGDNFYTITLSSISPSTKLNYQIRVADFSGQETIMPCEPSTIDAVSGDFPLLFINEFMADNSLTIPDEHGNYSDWIELYNGSSEAVFLGDFYLSDNLSIQDKWKMPDITLDAGAFVLFWADGEPELGNHHADLKLSKSGEAIGIFNAEGSVVDSLTFGEQSEDISYGRFNDGSVDFVFFNTPTPGTSNQITAFNETELATQSLIVFPNPASGSFVKLNKYAHFKVYNSSGIQLIESSDTNEIDIRNFLPGLYLIISEKGERIRFIVL